MNVSLQLRIKKSILFVAGLLIAGCWGTFHRDAEKPSNTVVELIQPRQLTLKELKMVGSYAGKNDEGTLVKGVLLKNSLVEIYTNGKKVNKYSLNWMLKGGEVHVGFGSVGHLMPVAFSLLMIKPNGDLVQIALIENGKRTDIPKENQFTFKKINQRAKNGESE